MAHRKLRRPCSLLLLIALCDGDGMLGSAWTALVLYACVWLNCDIWKYLQKYGSLYSLDRKPFHL